MKKKVLIIAGVLTATVVFGLGIYQSDASEGSPTLSYDEVTNQVSSQYPGTITEMELDKERNRAVYEIEIVNDGIEYELKVDGNSGEIIKLKEKSISNKNEAAKLEVVEGKDKEDKAQKEETKTPETKIEKNQIASNDKKKTAPKKENKNTVISMEKAIAIALKEFPGTVTEAELDEDDGRLIYEIEIEANDEEAEFEIDAMTGEIIVIEIDD